MGIKIAHPVKLTEEERNQLQQVLHKGVANTRIITRSRVLLMTHDGKMDKEIYEVLSLAVSTPYDIRKRYHEGGLNKALYDAPRPGQPRKLSGDEEAKVVTIACTKAPKGYSRWTMDLLTEEVHSKLNLAISRTAIYKVLLRNDTKPWRKKNVVHSQNYAGV
jgi:transposase